MEPFTPAGREPFTLATGRLFHADPGVVALQLARARLLPGDGTPRRALVASNPGGSLPLLETCSRTTAAEMANRGYEVTPLFGRAVDSNRLRSEFPRHDLVLWEGHHNTLVNEWHFPAWNEPLPPSFVFLQSCLALTEEKATPLLARGSVAVLGSSSRIYSATGGAFSGAYLDAVVYDHQPLGGALRQAKNFLAAYGELKEKRLDNARLTGANLRSAWAFTLWGDPTLRLPAPPVPADAKPAVRCVVNGDVITVHVPEATMRSPEQPSAGRARYEVPFRPNARLAGLVRPSDEGKLLVPLVFAEVPLPHGPLGATPRLVTKLGDSQWVFLWDARRRVGSLLAMPKTTAEQVIKFRVEWDQIAAQD
jgi:Peptidase family C25